jgi:hypothetical protein
MQLIRTLSKADNNLVAQLTNTLELIRLQQEQITKLENRVASLEIATEFLDTESNSGQA